MEQQLITALKSQLKKVKQGKRYELAYSPKGKDGEPVLLVGKFVKSHKNSLGTKKTRGVVSFNPKRKGYVLRVKSGLVATCTRQIRESLRKEVPPLKKCVVLPLAKGDLQNIDADVEEETDTTDEATQKRRSKSRKKKTRQETVETTQETIEPPPVVLSPEELKAKQKEARGDYRFIRGKIKDLKAETNPKRWAKTARRLQKKMAQWVADCPEGDGFEKRQKICTRYAERLQAPQIKAVRRLPAFRTRLKALKAQVSAGKNLDQAEEKLDALEEKLQKNRAVIARVQPHRMKHDMYAGLRTAFNTLSSDIEALVQELEDISDEDLDSDDSDEDVDDEVVDTVTTEQTTSDTVQQTVTTAPVKQKEAPTPPDLSDTGLSEEVIAAAKKMQLADDCGPLKEAGRALGALLTEGGNEVINVANAAGSLRTWQSSYVSSQETWDGFFADLDGKTRTDFILFWSAQEAGVTDLLGEIRDWWKMMRTQIKAAEKATGLSGLLTRFTPEVTEVLEDTKRLLREMKATNASNFTSGPNTSTATADDPEPDDGLDDEPEVDEVDDDGPTLADIVATINPDGSPAGWVKPLQELAEHFPEHGDVVDAALPHVRTLTADIDTVSDLASVWGRTVDNQEMGSPGRLRSSIIFAKANASETERLVEAFTAAEAALGDLTSAVEGLSLSVQSSLTEATRLEGQTSVYKGMDMPDLGVPKQSAPVVEERTIERPESRSLSRAEVLIGQLKDTRNLSEWPDVLAELAKADPNNSSAIKSLQKHLKKISGLREDLKEDEQTLHDTLALEDDELGKAKKEIAKLTDSAEDLAETLDELLEKMSDLMAQIADGAPELSGVFGERLKSLKDALAYQQRALTKYGDEDVLVNRLRENNDFWD